MENRFGFKDLILCSLLVAIIVSIWLAMAQRDREYTVLRQIVDQSSQQQNDLSKIESALANGVASVGSGQAQPDVPFQGRTAFDWIKKIEARPDYARGDWFVEMLPTHIPKITPLTYKDIYAQYVINRVEESLCYRDPNTFAFVPLLATSWTSTTNVPAWRAYVDQRLKVPITADVIEKEDECPGTDKPDDRQKYIDRRMKEGRTQEDIIHEPDCPVAQTLTFELRKGVQFSDGEPLTADDVVFTFNYVDNPKVDDPRDRSQLDRLKAVRKLGDYEVAFDIREPYFDSMFMVSGINIMPKHYYEKISIDDFNNSTGLLIGNGPYKLEDPQGWKPQDRIVLVRNERYWGEPAPFDRLIFDQVEEESVQTTMFKNGDVDYMTQLPPDEYTGLLQDKTLVDRTQHMAYQFPLYGYYFIGWNEKRNGKTTVFADKRVRMAMTMLIDRQKICDDIYQGYALPATGPFAQQNPQHDPSLKAIPYDPEQGKAILASLGFSDRNGTGVLSNAAGQELRFKFSYNYKTETIQRVALAIKDNLAKAGIAMDLDPEDWPIMMEKLDNRDFDAIMLGWSAVIEDDLYQTFHSSQMLGDGDNFVSYSNPDVDAAIVAARTELDEKARMPLWQKAERMVVDDEPYTFLYVRKELMFADKRIQNIEPSNLGLNYVELFVQPIPWYVPAGQRKWTK